MILKTENLKNKSKFKILINTIKYRNKTFTSIVSDTIVAPFIFRKIKTNGN